MKNLKLKIGRNFLNSLMLVILVIICLVFPNDILGLKKITFILLLLINFSVIFKSIRQSNVISVYGLIFPLVLWGYSFFLMGDIITPFLRVFCCFMLLLLYPILNYKIDYQRIILKTSWIIVFITLAILIMDLVGIIDVNSSNLIHDFFYEHEIGMMGKSSIYSGYYKIFMKASPILTFTLFNAAKRRKYFQIILVLLTLLVSGTRANMLIPIGMLIVCYVISEKKKKNYVLKTVMVFLLIIVAIIMANDIWSNFYQIFIAKGVTSDGVRMGHWKGLLEQYKRNPILVVSGTGMGSNFYSYGLNEYTSSIELPYLDMFRQMGMIFFIAFMIFILKPLFSRNIDLYMKCAYCAYLLIAATNPLLFSSTAFLVYIFLYQQYYEKAGVYIK